MNEILSINNVHGYMDKQTGTAYLNAEDVARGFGFTREKNGAEYVMWDRVNRYLSNFGFSAQVRKDDFLPENMVYRLGFKASNEVAQKFQALLADEVLPAIRRHGAYMTDQALERAITEPDFLIRLATQLKEEKEKRLAAEKQIEMDRPKTIFADAVSASHTSILVGEMAKILRGNGVEIGQKRFFDWLRENGYLIRRKGTDYNMPTQRAMELGLFEIKEGSYVNGSGVNIITKTPKITGKGQQYFVNKFLTDTRR
jgi:anti-repressor protein